MGNHNDRARQRTSMCQPVEVIDSIRETPMDSSAFRKAHVELVNRDDANIGWSLLEYCTPEIRPGRIAVNAQDRQSLVDGLTGIQHVPRAILTAVIGGSNQP